MEPLTLYILLIIFIATLVRSVFGFGESLIAVPLLLFFIPIEVAVPLSVLVSIVIAAIIVIQDRKHIYFSSARYLVIFALPGLPLGILLLNYGDEHSVKLILGLLIIFYSLYSLLGNNSFHLKSDHKLWLFFCGFLSGIFGGAYGLNGPPLIIYSHLRQWNPMRFRATLQAYFLPISTLTMVGYAYGGLWTDSVNRYFLISLPVVIPAIFTGRYIHHRIKKNRFVKYVFIGLLLIGIILTGQSAFRV